MSIAQYLPRWLRIRKPPSQRPKTPSKQERQELPLLPRCGCPSEPPPEAGEGPASIRALWHLRF